MAKKQAPVAAFTFDSISGFARHLDGRENSEHTHKRSSMDEDGGKSWDDGWKFLDAMICGLNGGHWPEGAKKMKAAHVATTKALSEQTAPALDYDVTGHTLDVGEYLTGNPTHWVNHGEDEQERAPILSIGVSVSRVHNVPAREIIYRGAAILSLVDAIEATGQRVELYAVGDQACREVKADVRVLIKGADQQWTPSAAAFGLAHPTFSRRLMFRMFETTDSLAPLTYNGYGSGVGQSHSAQGFDLYFGGVLKGDYPNADEAMSRVLRQYEKAAA